MPMTPRTEVGALRNFLFDKLHTRFLFLSFAQERKRYSRAFRIAAYQFCQLVRLGKNLIVQHFNDVVLLDSRCGGRSVRYDVVNDEAETFGQTQLLTDD